MTKTKSISECLPGQTYLIFLDCNSCQNGFVDDACFNHYLTRLLNCLNVFHIKLHAYCLLPQQIFLLLTPGTSTGVSSLLNRLNNSYSHYFNNRFGRRLRVWSDHPYCSLVQGSALVLDSQKYIEQLPLRRGKVNHAGAYQWSSYCANCFGVRSPYLTNHACFTDFIRNNGDAYRGYRELVAAPFCHEYEAYLDSRILFGRPLAKRLYDSVKPVAVKRVFGGFPGQDRSKSIDCDISNVLE